MAFMVALGKSSSRIDRAQCKAVLAEEDPEGGAHAPIFSSAASGRRLACAIARSRGRLTVSPAKRAAVVNGPWKSLLPPAGFASCGRRGPRGRWSC